MNKLNSWNLSYVLRRVMMKETHKTQRKRPKKLENSSCELCENYKWELRLYNSNRLIIVIKRRTQHTKKAGGPGKRAEWKYFYWEELLNRNNKCSIDSPHSTMTTVVIFPHVSRWLLSNCVVLDIEISKSNGEMWGKFSRKKTKKFHTKSYCHSFPSNLTNSPVWDWHSDNEKWKKMWKI